MNSSARTEQIRHIWHNYKGKNRMVMLWGDTHADFYQFLSTAEMNKLASLPPDMNWKWWQAQ